jgi:hypothetical protein
MRRVVVQGGTVYGAKDVIMRQVLVVMLDLFQHPVS